MAGIGVVSTVSGTHDPNDLVLWAGGAASVGAFGGEVAVFAVDEGLSHESLDSLISRSSNEEGSKKLHFFFLFF